MSLESVQYLWPLVNAVVWDFLPENQRQQHTRDLFKLHGWPHDVSMSVHSGVERIVLTVA